MGGATWQNLPTRGTLAIAVAAGADTRVQARATEHVAAHRGEQLHACTLSGQNIIFIFKRQFYLSP